MWGETVADSWFGGLWRNSWKNMGPETEKAVVGVLSHELASLMSKLVNLWHFLSDRQVVRLREEVFNSLGIQKLVSEDEDYIMDLAISEMIETLRYVGKAAAVLGKRCTDATYHRLEAIFNGDPIEIGPSWYRWEYRLKKMERRVKKMEMFIAITYQLYQELDVLEELEQTLRRMQAGADLGQVKLLEFQQKVMWQRQEVKNLREMSPWVRSYDYMVRLLLRSIFTIIGRIQNIFGMNKVGDAERINDSAHVSHDGLVRSNSISVLLQSSVHPPESYLSKLYSGPLGRSFSTLGLVGDKKSLNKNQPRVRNGQFRHVGSFRGCMSSSDSPIVETCMPSSSNFLKLSSKFDDDLGKQAIASATIMSPCTSLAAKVSLFSSKHRLLAAPPSTLGHAALALRYANVIVLIEKLASSPHLISLDARDDLYRMLPESVRTTLRAKLKVFKRNMASSVYDAALAAEWSMALSRILDWLSPLAHNMIRWHSERNFEKQHIISGCHMLLVQTLHFANQAKTEAAITELLLGLNYLTRFGQEFSQKTFMGSTCSKASNDNSICMDSHAHLI